VTILLKPFELLYRGVNRVRRTLYRIGVLRAKRLRGAVISIGNIAAGGAGKTPATIRIARHLIDRGHRVAVLTRGYGRASGATGLVDSLDAARWGDEPVLIAKNDIPVIVGSNRYENASRYEYEIYLLDDGFQHLQLERDVDVVIDVPHARFYREGRSALRDADVVIPRNVRVKIPDTLKGKRVFAFAALADNEQFFASLAGLDVVGTRGFRDHHRYTEADLAALRKAAGDAILVTTEKDAVKLDAPDVVAIPAEFILEDGVLERIVSMLPESVERRRKRRKSALQQRVEYLAYRVVARFVAARSDESLQRWGARLGWLAGKILRGRDRLAMRNLRAAFPDRDVRKILDEAWRHFGREALLTLRTQTMSLAEIQQRVDVFNAHLLDDAIARGRGTVVISAHLGSWEIAGLMLMSLADNVRTVARPLDNELLERDLQRIRAKTGAEMIDRRRAARPLVKGLAENAVIVLLPDQAVQPREGVLVPFLGRPAWTTPAPAKMALRAGSTIVFGFCIPDGLRHRLEFDEAIHVDELPESERDPVALTRRMNEIIARRISARPDLWLWMHDRWKGTAEGEVLNGM
jgi:KDO2-lipid IV(A) lauroyltransferase